MNFSPCYPVILFILCVSVFLFARCSGLSKLSLTLSLSQERQVEQQTSTEQLLTLQQSEQQASTAAQISKHQLEQAQAELLLMEQTVDNCKTEEIRQESASMQVSQMTQQRDQALEEAGEIRRQLELVEADLDAMKQEREFELQSSRQMLDRLVHSAQPSSRDTDGDSPERGAGAF